MKKYPNMLPATPVEPALDAIVRAAAVLADRSVAYVIRKAILGLLCGYSVDEQTKILALVPDGLADEVKKIFSTENPL